MEPEVGGKSAKPGAPRKRRKTKAEILAEEGSEESSGPAPEKAAPLPWKNLKKEE